MSEWSGSSRNELALTLIRCDVIPRCVNIHVCITGPPRYDPPRNKSEQYGGQQPHDSCCIFWKDAMKNQNKPSNTNVHLHFLLVLRIRESE